MQKKLIALAVASVMAAPLAAQAGVEVYGKARMSVDYVNNDDTGLPPPAGSGLANPDKSALSVSSNVSRIGFKGDEDLGNGLKAIWQIEQRVDFDTGGFATGARNTFLGLKGGFGTVQFGKYETPLRLVTQRIDIFSDTRADYNSIIGNVNGTLVFDKRSNNLISYTSPSMQGFGFAAAYSPSDTSDDLPRSSVTGKKNVASVNVSYGNGPLYLGAAYESQGKYTTDTYDAKATRLGGSWDFGQGSSIGGVWETADRGGPSGKRDAWYVNAAHKMGDTTLKGAVAAAGNLSGTSDSGAMQYSLGAFHALSKATEVYALYTMVNNHKNAGYGLWNGQLTTKGYGDKSVSALSVGLNYNFSSK